MVKNLRRKQTSLTYMYKLMSMLNLFHDFTHNKCLLCCLLVDINQVNQETSGTIISYH